MLTDFAHFTHRGYFRERNEDYYYIPDEGEPVILIVADGMGGHNAGHIASNKAVDMAVSIIKKAGVFKGQKEAITCMTNAITRANREVGKMADENIALNRMGTTLTIAANVRNKLLIAHVGDSRAYLIRGGRAIQITKDHSLVQEMVDRNEISADDMDTHPYRNVITRAVGLDGSIKADNYTHQLIEGDVILVCSDGLTEHVKLNKMEDMDTESIPEFVKKIGELALEGGGTDNITVVAARYGNGSEMKVPL